MQLLGNIQSPFPEHTFELLNVMKYYQINQMFVQEMEIAFQQIIVHAIQDIMEIIVKMY